MFSRIWEEDQATDILFWIHIVTVIFKSKPVCYFCFAFESVLNFINVVHF